MDFRSMGKSRNTFASHVWKGDRHISKCVQFLCTDRGLDFLLAINKLELDCLSWVWFSP